MMLITEALARQRQMYERQMQLLRSQLMSPSTPSLPYSFEAFSKMTPTGSAPSSFHPRYQQWAHDRFLTHVYCATGSVCICLPFLPVDSIIGWLGGLLVEHRTSVSQI